MVEAELPGYKSCDTHPYFAATCPYHASVGETSRANGSIDELPVITW